MKFEELIPELKKGKQVRRKSWNVYFWIKLINIGGYEPQLAGSEGSDYKLCFGDIEADDWELVENS